MLGDKRKYYVDGLILDMLGLCFAVPRLNQKYVSHNIACVGPNVIPCMAMPGTKAPEAVRDSVTFYSNVMPHWGDSTVRDAWLSFLLCIACLRPNVKPSQMDA